MPPVIRYRPSRSVLDWNPDHDTCTNGKYLVEVASLDPDRLLKPHISGGLYAYALRTSFSTKRNQFTNGQSIHQPALPTQVGARHSFIGNFGKQ